MHPAASVIFFTVVSGAGYGLLFVLALLAAGGLVMPDLLLGLTGFGISFAMVAAGLLGSTFHLGRPERAWRALSQWRSSWLSREGVIALLTFAPAVPLALLFCFGTPTPATLSVLGVASAACAAATVFATAMIYRSLKPIHAWCNRLVVPGYFAFAAATGALLAQAVLAAFDAGDETLRVVGFGAIVALAAVMRVKLAYWNFVDTTASASTAESATGLGALGKVRLLEAPHTQANYLMMEMGYRVARRHAIKLRRIALAAGMFLPAALTLLGLMQPSAMVVAAVPAAVLGLAGAAIERWLFFAQARHSVTLYYGADVA